MGRGFERRVVDDDPVFRGLAEAFGRAAFPRDRAMAGELSGCEREVLTLLADGLSLDEVAAELVVSRNTVGKRVEHIHAKLGARTRAHAVGIALRGGLLEPS